MMESGQNATESIAAKTKRGLQHVSVFGYCVSGMTRLLFSQDGSYVTITFDDHSTLKIERQSSSTHGLTARVVQELEQGMLPAPWEEV